VGDKFYRNLERTRVTGGGGQIAEGWDLRRGGGASQTTEILCQNVCFFARYWSWIYCFGHSSCNTHLPTSVDHSPPIPAPSPMVFGMVEIVANWYWKIPSIWLSGRVKQNICWTGHVKLLLFMLSRCGVQIAKACV